MVQREIPLYSLTLPVQRSDFRRAEVGLGAFEHKVILLPLGRITYARFSHRPAEAFGKVRVKLSLHDGRTIEGEETTAF